MDLNGASKQTPRARLTEYSEWFKGNNNIPRFSNRYSVQFSTPVVFRSGFYYPTSKYLLETGDNAKYLNLYADTVNLPSKQVTTASITNIGSAYIMQHHLHSVK